MQTLLLIVAYTVTHLFTSPYEIAITTVNGQMLTLDAFENKRMIVMTFDAYQLDETQIDFLDSLQQSDDSLQVICIPAINNIVTADTSAILTVQQTHSSGLIITMPGRIKKSASTDQHELMQWLTDVGKNNHFNMDGRVGQHFLISPSGILYGALDQGASTSFLRDALVQSYTGQ